MRPFKQVGPFVQLPSAVLVAVGSCAFVDPNVSRNSTCARASVLQHAASHTIAAMTMRRVNG